MARGQTIHQIGIGTTTPARATLWRKLSIGFKRFRVNMQEHTLDAAESVMLKLILPIGIDVQGADLDILQTARDLSL